MKLYTDEIQTARLIELGFPRPKFKIEAQITDIHGRPQRAATIIGDYSIGELIEMLEEVASVVISYSYQKRGYYVRVIIPKRIGGGMYRISQTQLVDALYDMIVKLKEKVCI